MGHMFWKVDGRGVGIGTSFFFFLLLLNILPISILGVTSKP